MLIAPSAKFVHDAASSSPADGTKRRDSRISRDPCPALRPFVSRLWASDAESPDAAGRIEHALPTGEMHLVFRLDGDPLWICAANAGWRVAERMLIGGPRARYYARQPGHGAAVGAMLRPGACRALFGAAAGDFADRHVALVDVWGDDAVVLHQRLARAASATHRVDLLEATLTTRFAHGRRLDPFLVHALGALNAARTVQDVVATSGLSHRAFIGRFRDAVGLAPKAYARVLRLQRTLRLMSAHGHRDGAAIAQAAGFADQAHLCRDFAELAGLSIGAYGRSAPTHANHVTVADDPVSHGQSPARSISFNPGTPPVATMAVRLPRSRP